MYCVFRILSLNTTRLVKKYAILSHTAFFFTLLKRPNTHTYTHFSLIRCLPSTAWVCNNGLWLTSPRWLCGTSWVRGKDFQYKEFTTFLNSLVWFHPTLMQTGTWRSFSDFLFAVFKALKQIHFKQTCMKCHKMEASWCTHSTWPCLLTSYLCVSTPPALTQWTNLFRQTWLETVPVYIDKFLFSPLSHIYNCVITKPLLMATCHTKSQRNFPPPTWPLFSPLSLSYFSSSSSPAPLPPPLTPPQYCHPP